VLAGFVGVLLAGCGEDPDRAAVRSYLEQVNAVQAASQVALGRADATLKAYAKGTPTDEAELLTAEADILNARDAVAGVRPPGLARDVHARLLHVYELDAGVAVVGAGIVGGGRRREQQAEQDDERGEAHC